MRGAFVPQKLLYICHLFALCCSSLSLLILRLDYQLPLGAPTCCFTFTSFSIGRTERSLSVCRFISALDYEARGRRSRVTLISKSPASSAVPGAE